MKDLNQTQLQCVSGGYGDTLADWVRAMLSDLDRRYPVDPNSSAF